MPQASACRDRAFAPPPEEALKYNPNHWPAGAPDSRGGQFAPGDAVAEQDAGVDPNRFNTPPKGWRYLTDCETRMAKAIFGNSIDYSAVKIHREKYSIGQSDDETVTPNGQMYLSPKNKGYADDYCSTGPDSRAHFIHEMTHVWQYQHGINVVWRRALGTAGITNDAAYDYHLEAGKPLSEYGIEQQAAIVQDYFRLSTGQAVSDRAKNDPKPTLDEYWRTIQPIREKKPTRS